MDQRPPAALTTETAIIDALGGATALGLAMGVVPSAVSNWRHLGIPYRHYQALVTLANKLDVRGITHERLHAVRAARDRRDDLPQAPIAAAGV